MKYRVFIWVPALSGLLFAGLSSCKKSPPPKPVQITPLQALVNSDTTLTLFHQMLIDANDVGLLADSTFSLLIPTNAVLREAGYSSLNIDSTSAFVLDEMLRYNYVEAPAIAPAAGVYTAFPTLLGASLYIEKDSASGLLLLNGTATASSAAVTVGKASVYYLGSLVPAAADSLPALLQSDSTLSFFAAAMAVTNLYDSALLTGSYTILAPVDSAFIRAGYDSVGAIDSANIDSLRALVEGQILKGAYLTNSFPVPGPVTDLLGNPVTVGLLNSQLQFSASGNAVPVNWLSGNSISGSHIILHKTDGLLSP
ncbi:MAG TPA: fasciclin domain-containing protein [Puia sp.]|nr:fasciclin domain-containing protein [Puia sp.]